MKDKRFFIQKRRFFYASILSIVLFTGCERWGKEQTGQPLTADADLLRNSIVQYDEEVSVKIQETPIEETQTELAPQSSAFTPEYKIIMVGDVLLHTPVEESCLQPDGSYDYDSLFSHTKEEIAAADLALVN